MNPYLDYFDRTVGNRDVVFAYFLNYLGKKPATILEIGAARNLALPTRHSDGWSSIAFAQYVMKYGGQHIVVDVSEEALANCRTMLDGIRERTTFLHMSGADALKLHAPDAVFLDGGDDPAEMVVELALIRPGVPVLCDDFHTKGDGLAAQERDYLLFDFYPYPPQMALFRSGLPAVRIPIPTIHF